MTSFDQRIYDQVKEHLLTQKRKSLAPGDGADGSCEYRGAGGLKCAIGALIKDEFYLPVLEGQGAKEQEVLFAVAESLGVEFLELNADLLEDLQRVHDWDHPNSWALKLQELAARWGLKP